MHLRTRTKNMQSIIQLKKNTSFLGDSLRTFLDNIKN
jgi:hypothetical protein